MKNDRQVRLLMSSLNKGLPLETAAAKAGMSEPTARRYRDSGKLPSQTTSQRSWRTRRDPFEDVWPEVVELLERDSGLQAKTIFAELQRRHGEPFADSQLRTLQRRLRDWRAIEGPEKEVYFPQDWRPGQQCQSDFTDMNPLAVTIQREEFRHLCYHFVLPYSNWEYVEVTYSETFEALSRGLQGALWELGAVPGEHRTDNLSAATHELKETRGRGFNERYLELLKHYGMKPSKNTPGKANENGDVESSHHHFKVAIDQRLRLSGRRDFDSVERYLEFLRQAVRKRNAHRHERLREELEVMKALPCRRLDCFREESVRVTRWSTVRVGGNGYSVPSRLRDERVTARVHADHIELYYKGTLVQTVERLRGKSQARIDYRHVVHSLLRKPGAFERYRYRDALFPTFEFRRCYDELEAKSSSWCDLEYVRILHLAATTMQCRVEQAIAGLLDRGELPSYEKVRDLVEPQDPFSTPTVEVPEPDLSSYDGLLVDGENDGRLAS